MTSDDNPRVVVPPPLIFAGLVASGLAVNRTAIALGPLQVIGAILGVTGVGLVASALGLFRKQNTRPEPWQPSNALVTHGVYRMTRNPMYLGMAMLSLGVALLFSSFAGSLLAMVAAVIIDRTVIPREEAYLVRRFAQDYISYAGRVRRWL
ncbi:MAG: isoprenylcysteine carboxylmethyltransferase family protein [Sphingomicrobium sp.]